MLIHFYSLKKKKERNELISGTASCSERNNERRFEGEAHSLRRLPLSASLQSGWFPCWFSSAVDQSACSANTVRLPWWRGKEEKLPAADMPLLSQLYKQSKTWQSGVTREKSIFFSSPSSLFFFRFYRNQEGKSSRRHIYIYIKYVVANCLFTLTMKNRVESTRMKCCSIHWLSTSNKGRISWRTRADQRFAVLENNVGEIRRGISPSVFFLQLDQWSSTAMADSVRSTSMSAATHQAIPLVTVRRRLLRQINNRQNATAQRRNRSKHDMEELFKLYYSNDLQFDAFQRQIVTGEDRGLLVA